MTAQLYFEDSTVRSFEATVTRTLSDRLVLDATHFYPTGGGQPHDTGTVETLDDDRTWTVTAVEKKDEIYHSVTGPEPLPEPGETVRGELDWDRRDAHMRYHTAQHLLSAHLLSTYDAETTGNQLYADHAHLDCAYDRFTETDLADIETALNGLVEDDREVRWYMMDRETAEAELDPERTRIALLPASITNLRIVEIAGEGEEPFDRTACAGTHVSATGTIGEISITGRKTQGSDHERINFELG
ncbi:alanyl-tRNA editing protein [Halalkalirubrum salinum]|uniref:alanyl-tRNA editing protein n=1 Tax=Halalkalirubrum salinum TaxID=2563889 RepID=UPI0010FB46BC|nr:alanyl-tRNA editing protein [Halalkalirubrum salinum]